MLYDVDGNLGFIEFRNFKEGKNFFASLIRDLSNWMIFTESKNLRKKKLCLKFYYLREIFRLELLTFNSNIHQI